MDKQDTMRRTSDFIRHSATIKIIFIGLMVLVLLIPASMISSILRERESRRDTVVEEISGKWGNSQRITGPFFTVPYRSFYKDDSGKTKSAIRYLHILPDELNVSGNIDPKIRYRGIYEAVLYSAKININGRFEIPMLRQSGIDPDNVLWDKAVFSLGISDMRGIRDTIAIRFDNLEYQANPGLKTTDIAPSGVQCVIPVSFEKGGNTFSLDLMLNGSRTLHFIPAGKTNSVVLKSIWPSPSFNGAFLPASRDISDKGFSAAWDILHLNRNFPQFWTGDRYKTDASSFGLKLLVTTDVYQKSIRISKYALMFIIFTFAAFFFSEILTGKSVHPIQYILIGLAVLLFYVLLLSVSEHLNFDAAYILSAAAITVSITGYSRGIIKNRYFTFTVFCILVILYAYLYIVLRLEDYALLMGSVGLFAVLITTMYISRKIDWYNLADGRDG